MDEKVKFELTPLEEEERTVSSSIEVVEEKKPLFTVEEIKEEPISGKEKEVKKEIEEGVSHGNIKANPKEKPLTKGYVYGGIFLVLGIASLLIAFLVSGYKMVGIICAVLAFLASYAMLKHVFDAKKIKALLDSGECKTVDELMLKLKRKNKYEFMRDLGGMIKAGYVAGYEVTEGKEIRKI